MLAQTVSVTEFAKRFAVSGRRSSRFLFDTTRIFRPEKVVGRRANIIAYHCAALKQPIYLNNKEMPPDFAFHAFIHPYTKVYFRRSVMFTIC